MDKAERVAEEAAWAAEAAAKAAAKAEAWATSGKRLNKPDWSDGGQMIQLGRPTPVARLLEEINAAQVGKTAGFAAWDAFHAESLRLGHGWAMYVARSEAEAIEAAREGRPREIIPQAWTPGWAARVSALMEADANPLLPYGITVPTAGERLSRVTTTGRTVWGVRPNGSIVGYTCRPPSPGRSWDLTVPVQVAVEHRDGTWEVEAVIPAGIDPHLGEEPGDTGQPEECWVVSGRRGREPGDWRVRAHRRLRLPGYRAAWGRHLLIPLEEVAQAIAKKRGAEEVLRQEESMNELIDSLRR
jgi:hypothetical protein